MNEIVSALVYLGTDDTGNDFFAPVVAERIFETTWFCEIPIKPYVSFLAESDELVPA